MGFGHRVYKDGDPRAVYLKELCAELAAETGNEDLETIADVIERVICEEKKLPPNLDWPTGRLYHYMGLPIELYTPLFVLSRVAGWSAHVIEQLDNNRLIRPRARYTGPAKRPLGADRRAVDRSRLPCARISRGNFSRFRCESSPFSLAAAARFFYTSPLGGRYQFSVPMGRSRHRVCIRFLPRRRSLAGDLCVRIDWNRHRHDEKEVLKWQTMRRSPMTTRSCSERRSGTDLGPARRADQRRRNAAARKPAAERRQGPRRRTSTACSCTPI